VILIADDEIEVRRYLELALRCHGYAVEFAEDGCEVMSALREHRTVSAVLLDVLMPRKDGIQTLREIRQFNRDLPVILLSGVFSAIQVVEAMKSGASDFLTKPISHEELCRALQKALSISWSGDLPVSSDGDPADADLAYFVGSELAAEFFALVERIARADVPVLIQGATGTGKEVLARHLHRNSRRAGKPFLKLNCAALPSELVESELFGYERGAFTGAFQRKAGMFEMADGGTLLLDEIGDMDIKLQAKLLQVLQDQTFQHLGGKDTIRVDVRILAATHRNLERAIADGTFREDLYYRLNVVSLPVPALRERKDQIIPLAKAMLRKHSTPNGESPPLPEDLQHAMTNYDWPGNVRELESFIRKYLILGSPASAARELRSKTLTRSMLPGLAVLPQSLAVLPQKGAIVADGSTLEWVGRAKEQAETETILFALETTRWNRKEAASLLGIEYKALLYKMKKLSITRVATTQGDQTLVPRRKARREHSGAIKHRSKSANSGV
jgi:two-component system, NtrC family, response regulator AtoC